MPNEEELRAMKMVHEHEGLFADLERRVKVLEDIAHDKEGAPRYPVHADVVKQRAATNREIADKHADEVAEKQRTVNNARENFDQMMENNVRPADEQLAATDTMPKEAKRTLEPDEGVTSEQVMGPGVRTREQIDPAPREDVDPPKRTTKR